MAALYADENFPASVTASLRVLGHDVLTAEDDGRAHQRIADADVLARATTLGRAVVTLNCWDFNRLHQLDPSHAGIVTCTDDPDRPALAQRVHDAISPLPSLAGRLIRVTRPQSP
jgi:hypothetical protein